MLVKIKDIAKALGLSPATVSLAFNNKPGVGVETRERVLQYAKEIGYEPNASHKQAVQNTQSIRFIVYKKNGKIIGDTPFFSQLIESIELETRKEHFGLVITYINSDDANDQDEIMRIIQYNPLDGIILLATEMDASDVQKFKLARVPVIILDNYFQFERFDTVVINNVRGAFEATNYLIQSGHKHIGYLQSSVQINNFAERSLGFSKAITLAGIDYNKNDIFKLSPSINGAYEDMLQELSRRDDLPTAFFSDNDIIAFGAVKALEQAGKRFPEDVSIIGFDDMPYCKLITPNLSTVKVFKKRLGTLAVKRIMECIRGETDELVKIEVDTELVIRKSVCTIQV